MRDNGHYSSRSVGRVDLERVNLAVALFFGLNLELVLVNVVFDNRLLGLDFGLTWDSEGVLFQETRLVALVNC